ncbi:MAG: chemotaxis protein CheW, partial [Gammaproteobacteria bacterium]
MLVFEPAPTPQDAELAAVEPDGAPAVITFDPTAVLQDTREIFLEEARDHVAVLKDAAGADPVHVDEAVVRALHTLAGGAGVVGETAFADLVRTALGLLEQRLGARAWVALDAPTASVFRQVVEQLTEDVDRLAAAESLQPHDELRRALQTVGLSAAVPGILEIMLALPGQDRLQSASTIIEEQTGQALGQAWLDDIVGALHGIIQHADPIEHTPLIELADGLLAVYEIIPGGALGVAAAAVLASAHEALLVQFDALAAGQALRHPEQAIAELTALQCDWSARLHSESDTPVAEAPPSETAIAETPVAETPAAEMPVAEMTVPEALIDRSPLDALDQELLAVFLEEAEELLDGIDAVIQTLASDAAASEAAAAEARAAETAAAETPAAQISAPQTPVTADAGTELLDALLRALHTLKGGARLAGLSGLGDEAHEFESRVIGLRVAPLDNAARRELQARYDGIARLVADPAAAIATRGVDEAALAVPIENPAAVESTGAEIGPLEAPGQTESSADQQAPNDERIQRSEPPAADSTAVSADTAVAIPSQRPAGDAEQSIPDAPRSRVALPPPRTPWSRVSGAGAGVRVQNKPPPGDGPHEDVIRVRAALLEELVNLAGESSIVRARLDQGLGEFSAALQEMHSTSQRLREQVRRLDIETEAQILFRQARPQDPTDDDFDPLELDRYSQLQQISRGLAESASDMVDLEETLRQRVGHTEALLVQQATLNTQLQEGLMRSRMVPFARLLPRLRRTVRQAAQALGKAVDLHAPDLVGELDRSLLDRMVAPLEHMLRNAVDHGIESPAARIGVGKPETGRIELELRRDGGDLLIEIADDGAGIDVARVRATAIERGLIAPDSLQGADELRLLIYAPGFSTASAVTQISGRGVGMDVVRSEVKQQGGSITVSSTPGAGTRFRLRVPFTVSVNRALMAQVGDELYAVPLNTIEGVVRLDASKLAALGRSGVSQIDYAGVTYTLRHLGAYLGAHPGAPSRPDPAATALPLLLVRTDDRAVALQVDAVQGSREIVVKSLGPQFAGVSGVSGATILGDGGVVVILDVPALVREDSEPDVGPAPASPDPSLTEGARIESARTVLVVDDSVTVRKVMTRLLERNGMRVELAKDGVEAIALLETRRPDILLLDIEMPRMDGFEVLRHVRHAPLLADLPVVMISS